MHGNTGLGKILTLPSFSNFPISLPLLFLFPLFSFFLSSFLPSFPILFPLLFFLLFPPTLFVFLSLLFSLSSSTFFLLPPTLVFHFPHPFQLPLSPCCYLSPFFLLIVSIFSTPPPPPPPIFFMFPHLHSLCFLPSYPIYNLI